MQILKNGLTYLQKPQRKGNAMNKELFRGTCKKYMELRHIKSKEDLRAHTTVGSNTTFIKYWHDPELLPMGVFEQIMGALNVPYEEQFNILRK